LAVTKRSLQPHCLAKCSTSGKSPQRARKEARWGEGCTQSSAQHVADKRLRFAIEIARKWDCLKKHGDYLVRERWIHRPVKTRVEETGLLGIRPRVTDARPAALPALRKLLKKEVWGIVTRTPNPEADCRIKVGPANPLVTEFAHCYHGKARSLSLRLMQIAHEAQTQSQGGSKSYRSHQMSIGRLALEIARMRIVPPFSAPIRLLS